MRTMIQPTRREHSRPASAQPMPTHRWLGIGLIALAAGLAANSLMGPLIGDMIRYPLSDTLLNQTIGLEAVSLGLVAPLAIAAGILALRGHRAGPVLAFGPTLYVVYMFVQYVVGPEYLYYPGILPFHLGLFTLGGGLALGAWAAVGRETVPALSRRTEQRYGVLLLGLAAFVVFKWLPALSAALAGQSIPAESIEDPSMHWSIVLLDLGIVVPATIAAAVALFRRAAWARKAMYAVVGWFALVPPSVAAMGITMEINDDPHAAVGQTVILVLATVVFAAFSVWLYRPLFGRQAFTRADRR
jgi:hypothetical protein